MALKMWNAAYTFLLTIDLLSPAATENALLIQIETYAQGAAKFTKREECRTHGIGSMRPFY